MNMKRGGWQYLLFSLMVGMIFLLLLEMISRVIFYQRHGQYSFALQGNIVAIKKPINVKQFHNPCKTNFLLGKGFCRKLIKPASKLAIIENTINKIKSVIE